MGLTDSVVDGIGSAAAAAVAMEVHWVAPGHLHFAGHLSNEDWGGWPTPNCRCWSRGSTPGQH